MARALITGVTGMAGSHLAEYLLSRGDIEVCGTYRWRSRMENLQDLGKEGNLNVLQPGVSDPDLVARSVRAGALNLVEVDLLDAWSMRSVIAGLRPDFIFHLAAQSFVPTSWHMPAETMQVNTVGQINLFEAVRAAGIDPLIHVAGSSEEYGLVLPHEVPMTEGNALRPLSPYAVSKVAQELLAWQYNKSYKLRTVVTRGFNHTGPRRGDFFATSSFAKQIVEIELALRPPVVFVGDLESKRDWTDVRDTVRGYWLALDKGETGQVYNIGSGVTRSVGEMLETLLTLTDARIDVKQDPARLRPSDVKILWADCTKFRAQTGWQPEIPFERTMGDLLDYWRRKLRG
ncbi:MAG: GDP-mannose 4,6-dehydratase [Chloroflexi bacterium]|nr:GDP-mannose 4,6-dehydratase [Chloroflexota bacterium]MCL5108159.1 GDP-mannose 4,6-dehydratase [Chloroflexota bacterium]